MGKVKENICTIITFGIAGLLTLAVYAYIGIEPFGSNTLMIWDMQWQYSSFLSWFHEVLVGNADWKYSFVGGLGDNTMGLISYYLSSPLNLILFFFNNENMTWGVLILVLLKSGCMAASMQWYLWKKRKDFYSILFGCMYALSSYVICYQPNIMWMDALILLPIIVYGIEELINNVRGKIYGITLGLAIFSNYYMGYMLCIFSVIYFLVYLFIYRNKKLSVKICIQKMFTFAIYSILAGGITAVLILPTIYNLRHSGNKHMLNIRNLISVERMYDIRGSLLYLLAGTFDFKQGIVGEYPLIYCGIFSAVLIILLFVARGISRREKVFYGALLTVMSICCLLKGPYLIFHGCYEPFGSPWRYSFLLCFVILVAAYRGLAELKRDNLKGIWITSIVFVLYLIWMYLGYGQIKKIVCNFMIVFALSGLYLYKRNNTIKVVGIITSMIAVVVCGAELIYNSVVVHQVQYTGRYESASDYSERNEKMSNLIAQIEQREADTSIYRVETNNKAERNQNDGYLFNLNTLEMYSSTEKRETWDIFGNMGWDIPGIFVLYDDNATNFSRNLVGLKYVFDSENREDIYDIIDQTEEIILYENKNAMPLGFLVDDSALRIVSPKENDFFQFQNELFKSLVGAPDKDIYSLTNKDVKQEYVEIKDRIVEHSKGEYTDGKAVYEENIELLNVVLNRCAEYTLLVERKSDGKIEAKFNNPEKKEVYACFTMPYESGWKAKVDGESVNTISGMGGFLLVPISTGEHAVELEYHIPYLNMGILLSFVSIILFIVVENKRLYIPKKK